MPTHWGHLNRLQSGETAIPKKTRARPFFRSPPETHTFWVLFSYFSGDVQLCGGSQLSPHRSQQVVSSSHIPRVDPTLLNAPVTSTTDEICLYCMSFLCYIKFELFSIATGKSAGFEQNVWSPTVNLFWKEAFEIWGQKWCAAMSDRPTEALVY